MDVIKAIEHEHLKNKVPVLDVGNTVKVYVKIREGEKERIQVFEGIIIKKQGGGLNETFTVRKLSYGVGVEKTFLVHSPMVEKVEVVRVGKARRAKLNYLRDRLGKDAKTREKTGARIENKEVVLKEEVETAKEEIKEEVAEPVEEVKTEVKETVKEEKKAEVKEAVKEEKKEEVKKEVKEEKKEEVKKEVKEEKKEETKKEVKEEKKPEVKEETKEEKTETKKDEKK